MILALDIGGTNPRMAMVDDGNIINIEYIGNSCDDLVVVINDYLKAMSKKGYLADSCSISFAGPIFDGKAKLTNGSYEIDVDDIKRRTIFDKVTLMNDWVAIGHAVYHIKEKDMFIRLNDVNDRNGNKAVFGPGTGLGGVFVHKGGKIEPSELGHVSFPYIIGFEKMYAFLSKKLETDVLANEAFVSGKGIRYVSEFIFRNTGFIEDISRAYPFLKTDIGFDKTIEDRIWEALNTEKEDPARLISKSINSSRIAKMTFNIFTYFTGIVAQSYALSFLAKGGVYIGGGIIAKNIENFDKDIFMKGFTNNWNKRFSRLLSEIPVYLIKDYDISLYGCEIAIKTKNYLNN